MCRKPNVLPWGMAGQMSRRLARATLPLAGMTIFEQATGATVVCTVSLPG
jgi:hypothetical protein